MSDTGAGSDGGTNASGEPGAPASAAGAPAPTPTPSAPPAPAGGEPNAGEQNSATGDDSPWSDPERAKREIERLRRENGDARINAKTAAAEEARRELLATISQALDPEGAAKGEELTVEQVSSKLSETATQLTDTARELAITKTAWAESVDPSKVEYLTFVLGRRADLASADPASPEFGATLTTAIREEIAKDSSLKLTGAAVGTGSPQFGGAGDSGAMSKAEFQSLPYAKRVELFNTNRAEYERLVNS